MIITLALILSTLTFANTSEIKAEKAREKVKGAFNNIDSKAYKKAMYYIYNEINKAAEKGDTVVLLNMDGMVYGLMYDTIEKKLKELGYKVKWNDVGGIPGTSYTMFIQISW